MCKNLIWEEVKQDICFPKVICLLQWVYCHRNIFVCGFSRSSTIVSINEAWPVFSGVTEWLVSWSKQFVHLVKTQGIRDMSLLAIKNLESNRFFHATDCTCKLVKLLSPYLPYFNIKFIELPPYNNSRYLYIRL